MFKKLTDKVGLWELAFIYLLLGLVFLYKCTGYNRYELFDYIYLYNRLEQLRTCLKDGVFPFFYYADALGAGQGTPFFYGQLTLLPFIFIKDYVDFTLVYTLCAFSALYFGLRSFYKRFSLKYRELTIITIYSSYGLYTFFRLNHMSCNTFALGLSFFFCAFCVDFFRDNKKCYKAVLMFFLILNTHLITTLVSFVACCFIFMYYFRLNRLKEYIKFALLCCVVGSYAICNYAYHSGVLSNERLNTINSLLWDKNTQYLGNNIFETVTVDFFLKVTDNEYFAFMGMSVFGAVLMYWIFSGMKHKGFLFLIMIAVLCSTRIGWRFTHLFINTRIQFPIRYFIFVVVGFFLVGLKDLGDEEKGVFRFIFLVQLPEFLLCMVIAGSPYMKTNSYDSEEAELIARYVANGEYLSSSFDIDYFFANKDRVVDEDGKTYDYDIDKNTLVVHDISNSSLVQVPKLYYKGYVAISESGKLLDVSEGVGQLCLIDVLGYSGDVTVMYRHPVFLVVLYITVWCFIACITCFVIKDSVTKRRLKNEI